MSNPNPVPNELTADNAALVRAGDSLPRFSLGGDNNLVEDPFGGWTPLEAANLRIKELKEKLAKVEQERDALREQVGKMEHMIGDVAVWALQNNWQSLSGWASSLKIEYNRDGTPFVDFTPVKSPSPSSCPKCEELDECIKRANKDKNALAHLYAVLVEEKDALTATCKGMEEALAAIPQYKIDYLYSIAYKDPNGAWCLKADIAKALATISVPNSKWSSTPTPEKEEVAAECAKCEEAKRVVTSLYRAADTVIEKATLGMGGVFLVHVDVFNALHDAVIQTPIQDYDVADDNAGNPVESPPPASPSSVLPDWWPDFIQNIAELSDRNSPDDEPGAMVATPKEIENCYLRAVFLK